MNEIRTDVPVVYCRAKASVPAGTPVPDDVTLHVCARCQCDIYVSPGTRELIDSGLAQPCGEKCVLEHMRENKLLPIPVMTPMQQREMENYRERYPDGS